MVSYKAKEKVFYDIKQYKLNPDLSISPNEFKFAVKEPEKPFDYIALCPFCLTSNMLCRYELRQGLRICPVCSNQLKLSTLINIQSIEEFAKFMFGYRFIGGWKKVYPDITTWKQKLKELGLSFDFWNEYCKLRGDSKAWE